MVLTSSLKEKLQPAYIPMRGNCILIDRQCTQINHLTFVFIPTNNTVNISCSSIKITSTFYQFDSYPLYGDVLFVF